MAIYIVTVAVVYSLHQEFLLLIACTTMHLAMYVVYIRICIRIHIGATV